MNVGNNAIPWRFPIQVTIDPFDFENLYHKAPDKDIDLINVDLVLEPWNFIYIATTGAWIKELCELRLTEANCKNKQAAAKKEKAAADQAKSTATTPTKRTACSSNPLSQTLSSVISCSP